MKNKLIITLLALTMTTAMLAGCGKETAEVQTADTEAVAEVSTEPKAVTAETDGKDAGTKTETKADSTKNDSATQAPAGTTTNTPAQTPAQTPAETPAPEPEAPAQNLCPYTLNQWLDLGNGWWGYYTSSSTPQETISALNDEFTDVIMTSDSTWTYDDWGGENFGDYDDYRSVQLTKFHMVPITN